MTSDWLKVMLEEIARKRDDQERARAEQARREQEAAEAAPRTGTGRARRDRTP